MENTNIRYKIDARIDLESAKRAGVESTDGYSVHDYFRTDLLQIYRTPEQAEEVAEAGYKGPDVDGVGCTWEITEVIL